MVTSNFETRGGDADMGDRARGRGDRTPSFEEEWMVQPEDFIWVDVPEIVQEHGTSRDQDVTAELFALRRQRDRIRRDELLMELQQGDEPPVPPLNGHGDGDESPEQPPAADLERVTVVTQDVEKYEKCSTCSGSGKRWFVMVCPHCHGLGSVPAGH